jgi:8-oxo-dGTP pyrophosphatase MutT (NUDIX family)
MSGNDAGDPFLDDDTPLHPGNAAAAILLAPGGQYLLQLRDRKRGIFFPGLWGCFGGATEDDDASVAAALRRELHEELGVDIATEAIRYFTNYTFDMTFCGAGIIFRTFFEIALTPAQFSALQLGEGSAVRTFSVPEVLGGLRLVPYDAFALWMHINRSRLGG